MTQRADSPVQSVYDLIRNELGGAVVNNLENPEGSTIGTTSEVLFRAKSARVAFVVINLSANVMFLRPSRPAATTAGIRLIANGGMAVMIWKEDFSLVAREWNIVADAGAGNQYYALEVVLT